jgi:hypothetical protein
MNVYLSSSWKNREAVRKLAILLRSIGHQVYDFTDPACRKTEEIPPERFPEQFDPDRHLYCEYIQSNAYWRAAVFANRDALRRCDAVVLMLPCGNDGHSDWAFAVGLGKRTCVIGSPKAGERTPTHLWADAILQDDPLLVAEWLGRVGALPPQGGQTEQEG